MKAAFTIAWINYRDGGTAISLVGGTPGGGLRLGSAGELELSGHQPVGLDPGQLVMVEVGPLPGRPPMVPLTDLEGQPLVPPHGSSANDPGADVAWCLAFVPVFGRASGLKAPLHPSALAGCLAGWLELIANDLCRDLWPPSWPPGRTPEADGVRLAAEKLRGRALSLREPG